MDKVELIRALCREKGITVNAMENELGLPTGTVNKMGKSKPNADRLHMIADYFELPMEVFYAPNVSIESLQTYRRLKRCLKANDEIFESDEELKELSDELEEFEKTQRKVYDIAAGEGRINDGYPTQYIQDDSDPDEYGWCQIHGDSMYPVLHDGDYVKIKFTTETAPTDLTAIRIDGDACTVKQIEITDQGLWVRAINKAVFEDRLFSTKEVLSLPIQIIGVVVLLQRRL